MKRLFTFAMLAGFTAALGGAMPAQGDPLSGADPSAGQAAPPAAGAAPGAGPGAKDVFGEQLAPANVVQPDPNRGQLGALASGAPTVPPTVQRPGVAAGAPAPAAAAPQGAIAGGGAAAAGAAAVAQTSVVQEQAMTLIQNPHSVARVIHHCLFRNMYDAQVAGQAPLLPLPRLMPMGPFFVPTNDLEIVGVGMLADAGPDRGPMYRVTFRNHGPLPLHQVRVSLIAVLGTFNIGAPAVTAEVKEIGANAIAALDIQMPLTVMALGPQGQTGPFETLIAAVDSFGELPESNELNNVATFTRGAIAVVETTVAAGAAQGGPAPATAVAPVAAPSAPAAGGPAPPAAQAPQAAPQPPAAGPAPTQPAPTPEENSALEGINLEKADGTSSLFREGM